MNIYRSNTKKINVAVVDSSDVAINITGMTLLYKVLDVSRLTKIEKTITVHDNAALGLTSISLTSIDTDLTPATYIAYYALLSNTTDRVTFHEEKLIILASEDNA